MSASKTVEEQYRQWTDRQHMVNRAAFYVGQLSLKSDFQYMAIENEPQSDDEEEKAEEKAATIKSEATPALPSAAGGMTTTSATPSTGIVLPPSSTVVDPARHSHPPVQPTRRHWYPLCLRPAAQHAPRFDGKFETANYSIRWVCLT